MAEIKKEFQIFYDLADEYMASDRSFKSLYQTIIKNNYQKKNPLFRYIENKKVKNVYYKELNMYVNAYQKIILDEFINIPKHTFVGLKLENSPRWFYYFFALLKSGYKVLLMNPKEDYDNTYSLLKNAKAKAIINDKNESFEGILTHNPIKNFDLKSNNNSLDDWENTIAFSTSGTTKLSRTFVYKGENIAEQLYAAYTIPFENEDFIYVTNRRKFINVLMLLPLSHIFGFFATFLWYGFYGATLVFLPSMNPSQIASTCIKEKITHLYAVPLFYQTLVNKVLRTIKEKNLEELFQKRLDYTNKRISKYEAGFAGTKIFEKILKNKVLGCYIKLAVSGGAYVDKKVQEIMMAIGYPLHNGYGMTEVGITSVTLPNDYENLISLNVGKPLYRVEYKITKGELLIKSKQIHHSLLLDGQEINPLLDQDGYFHTEDEARLNNDGTYSILGKKENVYIANNGENVYLEELDSHFQNLEGVNQVASVIYKNSLLLIVELNPQLTKEKVLEIINKLNEINNNLPLFKKVKDIMITNKPLQINNSMKIMRYKIVEMLDVTPEFVEKITTNKEITFEKYNLEEVKVIKKVIKKIFSEALLLDEEMIGDNDHFVFDLGGDSFAYMSLFAFIQEKYPLLKDEEIGKLNTINEFTKYILDKKN